MTREDQEQAADLLRRLLDSIDHGDLSADGPAAVALVRRLEGALLAVEALGEPPPTSPGER